MGGLVRCSGEVARKDAGIAPNNRQDPRCGHSPVSRGLGVGTGEEGRSVRGEWAVLSVSFVFKNLVCCALRLLPKGRRRGVQACETTRQGPVELGL